MNPEDWQQLEEIFQAATELPEAERDAFVQEVCGPNNGLLQQVKSLLASDSEADKFIESPIWTDSSFLNTSAKKELSNSLENTPVNGDADGMIGTKIGPFRLDRELGRGGMGAVYLAERADGEFQQKVAIKLIKRGMDSDFIIRRFRHERQILASFEHPFIARLLDGGTLENGIPYFVMEYVEGQTLYDYCDSKRMNIRDRLKLFQKLCSALEYAHQKQIVHRDIKPSNILVNSAGVPKLLDFGIAKILDPNLIHESINPTASMMRMMTPDYASPEQIQGVDVTPASDIYSLGVLLYELLSGHRPHNFAGRALHEVSYTICEEMPQPPSRLIGSENLLLSRYSKSETNSLTARSTAAADLREFLSGSMDNIVMKAVAKSPANRYSSANLLSRDISNYLNGKPVVAPEFTIQQYREAQAPSKKAKTLKNLAVLPFKFINLSADEDTSDKFLGLGLADALISRISKVRHLQVRPTSSILPFHETLVDPIKAGKELGVEFVLDGNIKKAANRLRVTIQLLNVKENSAIWATSIDEKLSDVLTLEDTLANKVVEALLPQFSVTDLAKRGTDVPEAFEHYLRGRYHFNLFTEEGLAKAFVSFHQAIAADPNYALAYTGLADYYNWLGIIGVLPPQECFQPAISAATKAVELDGELSEAHASLGFSLHSGNLDWKGAEEHLQRALQLNPSNANGFVWYANVLYTEGRFNEALNYARRAAELDPLTPFNHHNIGWGLYFARRFEEGVAQYEKVVQDFPNYLFGFYGLSKIHRLNGQPNTSLAEIDKAVEIMGDSVFTELAKAECLAADGQIEAAVEKLGELERLAQERYVSPYQLALGHVFLARSEPDRTQIHTDKAFSLLEHAFDIKEAWLNWMGVEPAFDVIRSDARFTKMLARTGYDRVLDTHLQTTEKEDGGIHDRTTLVIDATDITADGIREIPQPGKVVYAAAALAVLLGIAGIWFGSGLGGSQEPRAVLQPTSFQNPSLVVLPFSSGDLEIQNLGAGFADALSQRFGGIKGIQVVSANTGRAIAAPTPVEAARELGVTFVLRGSIGKTGNVFFIEAELVNVLADRGVWKETFSSPDTGIFSLQTQIARKVTDSLNIALLPAEIQRLEKSYTTNPAVYEQYLVGRSQMANRSADGLKMAIGNFAASVAGDPEFVPGYVGLADSYSLLNLYDINPPSDAYAKAKQLAERAISLDNEYAEAHASLAYIRFYSERNRESSELEFRRAIQMNPSYAQARHWFALVLSAMNKPVDALTEIQTAERLDPRSLAIRSAAAMVYFFDRKYDKALEQCDFALAIDPHFVPALKIKRWTYQAMGDFAAAKASFVQERNSMGGKSGDPGWQIIEAQLADTPEERALTGVLLNKAVNEKDIKASDYTFAFEIALAFEHLGLRRKALDWLERAERSGNHSFNFLEADPRLAKMRSEPRFLLLAEKLHTSK